MDPSIINNDAAQGETFLLGQIFVFGGFALRANSLGHLEQIDSYAPAHQVRFGSLNYILDICGDLIFGGSKTMVVPPCRQDEHDFNLSSDHAHGIAPVTAPALDPEQIAPSEDGRLNPPTKIADSTASKPHTDPNSSGIRVTGTPDPFPAISSEPCASAHDELD